MPDKEITRHNADPLTMADVEQLAATALVLNEYDILRNDGDDLLFHIPFIMGRPTQTADNPSETATFHYMGGEHGLLWKDPDHAVVCTSIHPELRALLRTREMIYVCETEGAPTDEDDTYFAVLRHTPNIDRVIETLLSRLSEDPRRLRVKSNPATGENPLMLSGADAEDDSATPNGTDDENDSATPSNGDDETDSAASPSETGDQETQPGDTAFRFGNRLASDPHGDAIGDIMAAVGQLAGAAPYKAYLDEWVRMRPLLRPFRANPEGPVEHLLFAIDPGCGCTTALRHLSGLMALDGPYGGEKGPYGETWQFGEKWLPDESTGATDFDIDVKQFVDGLADEQPGVLGIHMSHWLDRLHTPQFTRVLEGCAKLRHRIQFVFIIPFVDPGILSRVHARLSDQLNVRVIPFPPHTDQALTDVARSRFKLYGCEWDESANEGFARLLRAERHDLRFYGIRTAHKLVTELLIRKLQHETGPETGHTKSPDARIISHRDFSADGPGNTGPASPTGFERLDALEGLQSIKRRLREIIGALRLQRSAHDRGETSEPPCLHMLFTGPPGTGKTEVARILGQILREEKLLPQGDLIEATRFDMVGQYIGQTGPKTIQLCRSAIGSILFIDEAYLLASGNGDGDNGDFGREALGALIAEMENQRDRLMVILAGYKEEMENLFRMNPGLRDRVPHQLHFEAYDRDVLARIAIRQLSLGQALAPEAAALLTSHFQGLPAQFLLQRDFGNARHVRNLTERIRMKAMLRAGQSETDWTGPPDILPIDVESALAEVRLQPEGSGGTDRRLGY